MSDRRKRIIFDIIKKFKCTISHKKNTYEWFAILTVMFMKKTVLSG